MNHGRIAICTGGGGAPGVNAVIRAVVLGSLSRGWQCYGIRDGYDGLLFPDDYGGQGVVLLTAETVRDIAPLGGTILGTTTRGNPFWHPVSGKEVDRSDELITAFRRHDIDALIAIGGDGSMFIASMLARKGLRVIGVPKTIENDIDRTAITSGFDSAVSFATEAIDRLHSSADAQQRVMVVEVLGRHAGWIALNAGLAASADVILIPEIPFDMKVVAQKVEETRQRGQKHAIVVVAEGAKPASSLACGGTGRIGERVTAQLEVLTRREARYVTLDHLLRGGTPTSFDRLLSLRFGSAAVRALDDGESGIMVALDPPAVKYIRLDNAIREIKTVPVGCDTVETAEDLGISFGRQGESDEVHRRRSRPAARRLSPAGH